MKLGKTAACFGAILLAALLASLPAALAHHGTAASYDQETWITVTGKVTDFLWRNPHSSLYLDVTGEDGAVTEYAIELASPSLMVRQGYRRDLFKVGDEVTMRVHPSRAGTPIGECLFNCEFIVNGERAEPVE